MSGNVLYVAYSSLALATGGGRTRIISAARQAKRHGFTLRLLCFVQPPQLLSFRSLVGGRSKLAAEAQCKVYYVPRLPLTRISRIHSLNSWYCGLVATLFCLLYRIRIVHGHGLQPTILGLFARRFNGSIKVVADFHGATTAEYMYESELAYPDRQARQLEADEQRALQEADWIIFVSRAMRSYYQKKFRATYSNSSIIPCATDNAIGTLNGQRAVLRKEHGLSDRLVFCYAGSGENYQLPGDMCELFKTILSSFPNAFFLIFSHHTDVFLRHLKEAGIDSCHYEVSAVSHTEIFNLLQMGDFGFLLRDGSVVNKVASPTKFGEYCLSGLPVITTNSVGDFSEMTRQHELGCIVDVQNLSDLSTLAPFIAEVQKNREDYRERCFLFAREHLAWDAFGADLAGIYDLQLKTRNVGVQLSK
jgi:glycosyltransferase involved in cell wall biosynthesis